MNRIIPYPPNFNRTAAKIIDPSSGASTWALGNHKCIKYIGIFAKKANIINVIILNFIMMVEDKINVELSSKKMILISNGNEAVTV